MTDPGKCLKGLGMHVCNACLHACFLFILFGRSEESLTYNVRNQIDASGGSH